MNKMSITLADFSKIVGKVIEFNTDITSLQINPPVINGTVGDSEFCIDFDDNGTITGNYSWKAPDKIMGCVLNFADDVQNELDYLLMNGHVMTDKDRVYVYDTKRQIRANGHKLEKCPNCGGMLAMNAHICSFCGYEISQVSLAEPVALFIAKLERCKDDSNRKQLIKEYQFPTQREVLLDAMTLIMRKMRELVDSNGKKIDNSSKAWLKLWSAKALELRKQQGISFINDNEINAVFHEIELMMNMIGKRRIF